MVGHLVNGQCAYFGEGNFWCSDALLYGRTGSPNGQKQCWIGSQCWGCWWYMDRRAYHADLYAVYRVLPRSGKGIFRG